jgi:hypothetical protein
VRLHFEMSCLKSCGSGGAEGDAIRTVMKPDWNWRRRLGR